MNLIKKFNKYALGYRLNRNNEGIINMVDVGSVGGLPEIWNSHAHQIKFLVNFDPNEKPAKKNNFVTYNKALWEKDEIRPFYIYKGFNNTGSSLFEQNYEYVLENFDTLKKRGPEHLANTWYDRSELEKEITMNCYSLDNIIKKDFPELNIHMLKIDAQGAEYNVLKGAEDIIESSCVGIQCELFTVPLYKGIKLFDDVRDYLETFGFKLAKKYPAHGSFDSQNECVFINPDKDENILKIICNIYGVKLE